MKKTLTLTELEQQLESRSKELQSKARQIEEQSLKDWKNDLEKSLKEELIITENAIRQAAQKAQKMAKEEMAEALAEIREEKEQIREEMAEIREKARKSAAWRTPAALAITALVMFLAGMIFDRLILSPPAAIKKILDPAKVIRARDGSRWYPVDQIPGFLFKPKSSQKSITGRRR
jgi:hypothetical protein